MDEFSLTCFGIGDGTASADRNHSAYLYRLGGTSILIDCGEPISRSFAASGLGYEVIDRICISHLHSDHAGGLFMLLQGFWLEHRRKPLTINLPADGIEPVTKMLHAAYLFPEVLPFPLRFEPLAHGVPLAQDSVRVTPYRTTHLEALRKSFQAKYPGDYSAYCFLVESGKQRIAHSADLGAPEDLEPLLKNPIDLLVCEVAHFAPESLFSYLKGKRIGQIVFMHLSRWNWQRRDEIQKLAAEMLPAVKHLFARDGLSVPL
ncbi:MAG: MBL fold metallo-hydrolase [Verrucomicrobia subdivision 3 bacterium]|nr:MBL fold metallo-hydrolase [Limisphaerales bacterium]